MLRRLQIGTFLGIGSGMTESTYRIHGATGEWEVVIGLEVHVQVTGHSKLFSGATRRVQRQAGAVVVE